MNQSKKLINKFHSYIYPRRRTLQTIGFYLLVIMLFVISRAVREQVILSFTNRVFLYQWNVLAYAGLALLILAGGYAWMTQQKNRGVLYAFLLLPLINILFLFLHCITFGKSMGVFLVYTCTIVLPLYLMYVELDSQIRARLIRGFLLFMNILMTVMAVWAVLDYFMDHTIAKWFVDHIMTINPNFYAFAYGAPGNEWRYRFTGIWEDSLPAAAAFNLWYLLNIIWNENPRNKKVYPTWLVCILALLGLCCCNSKAALAVAVGISAVAFYRNLKMIIFFVAAMIVGLASGIVTDVIKRFLHDETLTSGRLDDLKELMEQYSFYWFRGHGIGCDGGGAEFGVVSGAFQYGIFYSILLFCLVLGYMSYKLLRKGTIHILLLWGLYFAQVNTFHTGFGCESRDDMMILCFASMLILNMVQLRKEQESLDSSKIQTPEASAVSTAPQTEAGK